MAHRWRPSGRTSASSALLAGRANPALSGGACARKIPVKAHRLVVGRVKTLRLKRQARRWYVIVVAEQQPLPLPATGREIGLDIGVARFAAASDGQVVANPRFLAAIAGELAAAQRGIAGCRPGSGNRRRAKRKLAKLHRTLVNQRRDPTTRRPENSWTPAT